MNRIEELKIKIDKLEIEYKDKYKVIWELRNEYNALINANLDTLFLEKIKEIEEFTIVKKQCYNTPEITFKIEYDFYKSFKDYKNFLYNFVYKSKYGNLSFSADEICNSEDEIYYIGTISSFIDNTVNLIPAIRFLKDLGKSIDYNNLLITIENMKLEIKKLENYINVYEDSDKIHTMQ